MSCGVPKRLRGMQEKVVAGRRRGSSLTKRDV
jgi:hypothetical protein